jgi:hypothetical protein
MRTDEFDRITIRDIRVIRGLYPGWILWESYSGGPNWQARRQTPHYDASIVPRSSGGTQIVD